MATWQDLGQDCFNAAGELRRHGRWRSAISRAYYAAYSRIVQGLIARGVTMPARGNPSHVSLPSLVVIHLVDLSHARRSSLAAAVRRLYRLRLAADYQPATDVGEPDWRFALGLMAQVFRDMKETTT